MTQSLISIDDKALVQRVKRRDAVAMAEICQRYRSILHSVVRRSVADPALAEDIVQDSFLVVWRRIQTFDDKRGSLRSWMITIAHHRAIDHLRSEKGSVIEYMARLDDLDDLEDREQPSRPRSFLGAGMEAGRLLRRMETRAALETLNGTQRKVLELAYFVGLTQTEIAARLLIPLGTAKTLVRGALKALRQSSLLQDGEGEHGLVASHSRNRGATITTSVLRGR